MTILKPFKKDKLLIVGLGSIGEKYNLVAKKFFNCKNIFFYSKHKRKKNLSDLKKLKDLNYIILSNRSTDRMSFFKSFIRKKATYIFEKPIAANALNTKNKNLFFRLIKKNKIKIKSGYCLRANPAVKELKKIIKNNLDNILSINMDTNSFLPSWRSKNYKKSVSAKKEYGGGVLNELSHEIDLILYLFGKPKSLFASYYNTKFLNINTEDSSDIIFNMNDKLNINLHLDFCSYIEKRQIEIILKNKTKIILDLKKNCIHFLKTKKNFLKHFPIKKYFYLESQIKEMLKISKSKKNHWISELNDAIYVLYIIKKIRDSNSNKKLVYLERKI